jgi:hypothetical protein
MNAAGNQTDAKHFRLIADITTKWRDHLSDLGKSNDQLLAGYMVGAALEADVDIEELERVEPLLLAVFETVGSLETPLVPNGERPKLWAQVRAGVAWLEKKYLPTAKA